MKYVNIIDVSENCINGGKYTGVYFNVRDSEDRDFCGIGKVTLNGYLSSNLCYEILNTAYMTNDEYKQNYGKDINKEWAAKKGFDLHDEYEI